MDLPRKPSVSSAVLHYLFQLKHNKLAKLWKALFQFELQVDKLPSKTQVTQYALVTRALLYMHSPKTVHLATNIVQSKIHDIKKDKTFLNHVRTFLHSVLTKEELKELYNTFSRPIAGSPMYVKMFTNHRVKMKSVKDEVFVAWTKVANMAGDTNTTFKPSTLKHMPNELKLGFEKYELKKGKVPVIKTRARKIKAKRKAPVPTCTPSKKIVPRRYPDPPNGGWMGLITGTALCNFVTHMIPISGSDLQLQMVKVNESKTVMLTKTSVEHNFILQTTANVVLFNTQLKTIPGILVNAQDMSVISKHFVKTAVCLIFCPSNPDYNHKPTLTFSSTHEFSSTSFTLIVKIVESVQVAKRKSTFHGLTTISMSIKLLRPLMSINNTKHIRILCQVDNMKKRLYITFETLKTSKTKLCATNHFSAELAKSSQHTSQTQLDDVSLFLVDTSNMYMGKLVPNTTPKTTNIKAYTQAKESNSLQTIFSETYKLGLLKAITKGILGEQKICFIMTNERWLLMTIHEYRGSIQVAQMPNIESTSS